MTTCFLTILNMSVTAAVTAVAVMLARAVFKKLPKWLTCALWAAVGLRLLFPFSVESAMSLIPRASTVRETVGQFAAAGAANPAPVSGSTEYFIVSNFIPPTPVSVPSAKPFDWLGLLTWIWLAGAAVMLAYMIVSAVILKRRIGATVSEEKGVYLSDTVEAPFVLGVLRPRIYLPSSLSMAQKEMILAHERAHLKRGDHVVKPLAFLLLSVYWFNPVLWVAYALLCRDIELACDERVIRDMDREEKAFYSQTLLDCGRQRKSIAACPLAFGEVGVKERVKNVLNYKKPAFWIILIAIIAGVALAVCFLTNPKNNRDPGVWINTIEQNGNVYSYEIKENGTLEEKPLFVPTDMTVYHSAEGCFSTVQKGDATNNILQKTELLDENGQPVVLTDDHRAIFDAVMQWFDEMYEPILQMNIYESHNGDERYFVTVSLDEPYWQSTWRFTSTYVFHFSPSTGELDLLAKVGDCDVTAVYAAAEAEDEPDEGSAEVVQDAGINSRIFATLKEQRSGSYLQGEYYAEAHHIYGTEKKDGKTVVYAMVREAWFRFVNGYFTEVSGGQYPAVFTFDGDDCQIERAQDGGLYGDSIKAQFPKKYATEILKHGDRYNDKLWIELVRQATNYLKSIGRTATVCPISEAGLSTLTAHGVSAEVSNKLTEDPRFDQYPFYGTEERIENGVRYLYSVSYYEESHQIVYEKAPIGEGPAPAVERIVVNGETGEIISTYSAPVGPVEKGKDIQIDVDWIEAAKIDERTIDIDGDGTEDRCVMSYGPTSGFFYLTVTPEGADEPKYQNIFLTDHSTLSFPVVKSDPTMLYVQAVNPLNETEIKNYIVMIENGELVLRAEDGDMAHWGEATGSDTSQSIFDSITLDVDGDGTDDYCTLRFGPTSGLYTIRLTIQPIGAAEPTYENIFNGPGEPSFVYVKRDNALYVKGGAESGIRMFRVVLENGRIALRGKNGDVTYWVGEDDDLFPKRQKKLKGQVPELFNLDASKGLDVYVWHWGNGYRCWVTEATKEQKKAWQDYRIIPDEATGFSALTPEDVRAILAFYDIPAKKVTVIPYQHPLSSYLWAQDGKIVNGDVTMEDLREMLGL